MKHKQLYFNIALVAVPLVLLFLFEVILRISNYAGRLELFVLKRSGDISEYVLNDAFTRRYFFQKGIKTPTPLSQRFSAQKAPDTYRIFCLGESTTQGFPYPPNAAFPALLEHILQDVCPDRTIEVLNCGITAVTSYCVLDIEKEILQKYQPDLLVIYTGHNEFYGVFGQASTLSSFKSRSFARLFLSLQRFKLFLLIRDAVNGLLAESVKRPSGRSVDTLMSLSAKDIDIDLNSETVRRALDNYRRNLEAMCRAAQRKRTPIVLCTQVANVLDLPPFGSKHGKTFSQKDSLLCHEAMQQALALQSEGRWKEALPLIRHATALDSTHAMTRYRLGRCLYVVGEYEEAGQHLRAAADLDVVRFRAPSLFNQAVISVAEKRGVPLADCAEAFRVHSPHGLPGGNLLHEHVHPNLNGQLLIARTVAQTINDARLLDGCDFGRTQTDSAYIARTRLTILDHEVVNYTLYRLTSRWPFPPEGRPSAYQRLGDERTEALAKAAVDGGRSLVELHVEYGDEMLKRGLFVQAALEYEAASAAMPLPLAFDRLGRLYSMRAELAFREQSDFQAAQAFFLKSESYYKEGLKREPNDADLRFNLGLLYLLRRDYFEAAAEQFMKVIEIAPNHVKAHRFLIELHMRERRLKEAKDWALRAVRAFPNDPQFHLVLGVIAAQENDLKTAEAHLEQAVRLGDDGKAAAILAQVRKQSAGASN